MIALIANDAQKDTMVQIVGKRLTFFRSQLLVATCNTGKLLEEKLAAERGTRCSWAIRRRPDNRRSCSGRKNDGRTVF